MHGFRLLLACCLAGAAATAHAQTELHWFGHAAFSIKTPSGKVLLIDPWLSNEQNPAAKNHADPLAALGKVDYILLTHGHRDHVGEAAAIAAKTGAVLVANPELAGNLVKLAGYPKTDGSGIMGIGGELKLAGGEVTVAMTPAMHSSSVYNANAGPTDAERAYGGMAAGFVVMVKNGPTIYHSGDTAYFMDMRTIGEQYRIDVALLNIGGRFGMEPTAAAKAAAALHAGLAIPQHYGSEGMTLKADGFAAELAKRRLAFREMQPGETLVFDGRRVAPRR
jgi:L-ascorbate metabolism protein UlaG (beta-lactamase superfamily)